MADTNIIKLGNADLNFKVGSSDCKIYLGEILLYPHSPSAAKFYAEYSNGQTKTVECNSSTELTSGETQPVFSLPQLMTAATIGDCVTSIGSNAFYGCSSLPSIDIPSGITSIGETAFGNCNSLTSVTIPNGVTSIGNMTFWYCHGLTSVSIGSGLTTIGDQAFFGCDSLTSVTIPSSVTSIGDNAFGGGCSALTSVTINAATPPILGNGAFDNTNDCPIYVLAASVNAYKSASGWSTYAYRIQAIPSPFEGKWKATYSGGSITSADCDSTSAITSNEIALENLTAVEIGDCVTSISDSAFQGCNSLTSIEIPDGVTSISNSAFSNCSSLPSITIPSSVTSIGNYAFYGCSGLTSVTIPSGVTSIGQSAFNGCSGLTSITIEATTPPTLGIRGSFSNTNNCPIYVPSESVDAYKTASRWSTYADRIFPFSDEQL